MDLRGHGGSDWDPDGDYSTDAFVRDVVAAVRHLGGNVHLVGASLGGLMALVTAGEHPGVATSLTLVDVVPRIEPSGAERVRSFMEAGIDGFDTPAEAAAAAAAYRGRPVPPDADRTIRPNLRVGEGGRWHWHWDPAYLPAKGASPRARDYPRIAAAAQQLCVPVLVLHGQLSDVVSERGLVDLLALVPTAKVVNVADVGHMIVGDDNDALVHAVGDFLEDVSRRGDETERTS
jgi:pimeloyl-ACP methyl ester carboxylesterase